MPPVGSPCSFCICKPMGDYGLRSQGLSSNVDAKEET
jgi:hypothetical protein